MLFSFELIKPNSILFLTFVNLLAAVLLLNLLNRSLLFALVTAAEDPVSQRLQQRRRSQADPLRRMLLTTQMKVSFLSY